MNIFDSISKVDSIYHYALGLLGVPETDGDTMTRTQFIRSANVWYRNIGEWIWKNSNSWQFDDSNRTTLPTATTDLVASQADYQMENTVFDILRVEVLDVNGDYIPLTPLKETNISSAKSEFCKTDGMPTYYELVGDVVILYPAPSADKVTTTDGLKIYVSRDIDEFTITDTSTEPGIPRQFHDMLAVGAVHDIALRYNISEKWQQMTLLLNTKRKELEEHYSKRHKNIKTRIIPRSNSGI